MCGAPSWSVGTKLLSSHVWGLWPNLASAQTKMKHLHDSTAEKLQFSPGDQVLALLPLVASPFQAKSYGPYTVLFPQWLLFYLGAVPTCFCQKIQPGGLNRRVKVSLTGNQSQFTDKNYYEDKNSGA